MTNAKSGVARLRHSQPDVSRRVSWQMTRRLSPYHRTSALRGGKTEESAVDLEADQQHRS